MYNIYLVYLEMSNLVIFSVGENVVVKKGSLPNIQPEEFVVMKQGIKSKRRGKGGAMLDRRLAMV